MLFRSRHIQIDIERAPKVDLYAKAGNVLARMQANRWDNIAVTSKGRIVGYAKRTQLARAEADQHAAHDRRHRAARARPHRHALQQADDQRATPGQVLDVDVGVRTLGIGVLVTAEETTLPGREGDEDDAAEGQGGHHRYRVKERLFDDIDEQHAEHGGGQAVVQRDIDRVVADMLKTTFGPKWEDEVDRFVEACRITGSCEGLSVLWGADVTAGALSASPDSW